MLRFELVNLWFVVVTARPLDFETKARRFNGIGVKQIKITEDRQSRTIALELFIVELAIVQREIWTTIVQNLGQSLYIGLVLLFFRLWSINEDTVLIRVRVNVKEHLETACLTCWELSLQETSQLFDLIDTLFSLSVIVSEEVSVHVLALQVVSVVTCHDTIRVYDRNDPGLETLSELVREKVPR